METSIVKILSIISIVFALGILINMLYAQYKQGYREGYKDGLEKKKSKV